MDKLSFYKLAMKNDMYKSREWILRSFTIIPRDNVTSEPFMPSFEDGKCTFIDENGNREELEGYVHREILFDLLEPISITASDCLNLDKDVDTSYGNYITNCILFVYGTESKIPYMNSEEHFELSYIDTYVAEQLSTEQINIDDYKRFMLGMDHMSVFTSFVTPVGSERIFQADKGTLELRDKLLKKHAHELHIPAVATAIEEQVVASDKAAMAGDPGTGFLISKKHYGVRKKQHYFQGIVEDFEHPGKVDFIKSSLTEGWKPEELPSMVNNLRSGSFSRGALTALGGVSAKQLQRTFMNTRITEKDCGSKVGINILITKDNKKEYSGRYSAATGELAEIKVGNLILRDPGACNTLGGNFCEKCMGDRVVKSKLSLGVMAGGTGSVFLSLFLSAFHAKDLALKRFDIKARFI